MRLHGLHKDNFTLKYTFNYRTFAAVSVSVFINLYDLLQPKFLPDIFSGHYMHFANNFDTW